MSDPLDTITTTTPSHEAVVALADEIASHLNFADLANYCDQYDDARDGAVDLAFLHARSKRAFRISITEVEA
jgi:hypothetical protein